MAVRAGPGRAMSMGTPLNRAGLRMHRRSAHNLAADLAHQCSVRPGLNGVQVEACGGQQALAPVHVQLQGQGSSGGRG